MCVILAGAPWEGFTIYGPFQDGEQAEAYKDKHLVGADFWWILPIEREV